MQALQVVLAEFDIDKGSCIRARYPEDELPCYQSEPEQALSPTKGCSVALTSTDSDSSGLASWDHYLADQMLPDGAEKHTASKTVFALNRSKPPRKVRVPVYIFVRRTVEHTSSTQSAPSDMLRSGSDSQESHVLLERTVTLSAEELGLTWSRHRAGGLPHGFLHEVFVLNALTNGVVLQDEGGSITREEVAGQTHTLELIVIPDEIALFARRLTKYLSGDDWDAALLLPQADVATGHPVTPTLVPHSSPNVASGNFGTATVVGGAAAASPSLSTATAPSAQLPFKFATLTSSFFSESYGLLFHDRDYFALTDAANEMRSRSDFSASASLDAQDSMIF